MMILRIQLPHKGLAKLKKKMLKYYFYKKPTCLNKNMRKLFGFRNAFYSVYKPIQKRGVAIFITNAEKQLSILV